VSGIFFVVIVIGLPATFGAQLLVKGGSEREQTAGGVLVFFAAVITLVYVFILPTGRMLRADYSFIAPVTFIVGLIGGGLWGYFERKSG
jgi:hypothetical protein